MRADWERSDYLYVLDRFPRAPAYLVDRLGRAITRRRKLLLSKRLGQERLRRLEAKSEALEEPGAVKISEKPHTDDSSAGLDVQSRYSEHKDIESDSDLPWSDNEDEFEAQSGTPDDPAGAIRGKATVCHLCSEQIYTDGPKAWRYVNTAIVYGTIDSRLICVLRKHMKTDLRPYICTQEGCLSSEQLFISRNEWFEHEMQFHRRSWICVEACGEVFHDVDSFKSHIAHQHRELLKAVGYNLQPILNAREARLDMDASVACELCQRVQPSLSQLRQHLGQHQVHISLRAGQEIPTSASNQRQSTCSITDANFTPVECNHVPGPSQVEPPENSQFLIIHQVRCSKKGDHETHPSHMSFLDLPKMFIGDSKEKALRGRTAIDPKKTIQAFDWAFVVYKRYSCDDYYKTVEDLFDQISLARMDENAKEPIQQRISRLRTDGPEANVSSEELQITSTTLQSVMRLCGKLDERNLTSPYLIIYKNRSRMADIIKKDAAAADQVRRLLGYFEQSHAAEYADAESLFARGLVNNTHLTKLFTPGDVVVTTKDECPQAYVCESFAEACNNTYGSIQVRCWCWDLSNRKFHKQHTTVKVQGPTSSEPVPISSLTTYPLSHDVSGMKKRLEVRGRVFWLCRNKRFVECDSRQVFSVSEYVSPLCHPPASQAGPHCLF